MFQRFRMLSLVVTLSAILGIGLTGSVAAVAMQAEQQVADAAVGASGYGPCTGGNVVYEEYPNENGSTWPDISHHYVKCPPGWFVEVRYENPHYVVSGCVGEAEFYAGPRYPAFSPLWRTNQWYNSTERIRGCGGSDQPLPQLPFEAPEESPVVNVKGQVVAPRYEGADHMEPLSGARYRLKYRDRSGQWLAVRQGEGNTGEDVAGYLDDDGEFHVQFPYPQDQELPDGSTWQGCTPTETPIRRSTACAPGAVVLEVIPRNEDGSIVVRRAQQEEIVAHVVALGQFFGPDYQHVTRAQTPAAIAYRGTLNVIEFAEQADVTVGDVTIQLETGGISQYQPWNRLIRLNENAPHYVTEHEVGHRFMHNLYGKFPGDLGLCNPHYFELTSTPRCAWVEGFAGFVAIVSQNVPGSYAWDRPTGSDIDCLKCQEGASVEGRVAGALFDLVDDGSSQGPNEGPVERYAGFADHSTASPRQLMEVIRDAKPTQFSEFWAAWVDAQSGDLRDAETMWVNTLHYEAVTDDSVEEARGSWEFVGCARGFCRNVDAYRSSSPNASATWSTLLYDVDDDNEVWDIWVHIPAGVSESLDPQVRYEVVTTSGKYSFTVDQSAAEDSWVPLRVPSGFVHTSKKRPLVVNVHKGGATSRGTSVVIDSIVIAPHLKSATAPS